MKNEGEVSYNNEISKAKIALFIGTLGGPIIEMLSEKIKRMNKIIRLFKKAHIEVTLSEKTYNISVGVYIDFLSSRFFR